MRRQEAARSLGRTLGETQWRRRGACLRREFHEARGDYQYNVGPATEAATLYLPASQRARFIDETDPRGTRTRRTATPPAVEASQPGTEPSSIPTFLFLLAAVVAVFFLLRMFRGGAAVGPSTRHGSAQFAPMQFGMPEDPKSLHHGTFLGFSHRLGDARGVVGRPVVTTPEAHRDRGIIALKVRTD